MLRSGSWWVLALVAGAAVAQGTPPADEPEAGFTLAQPEAEPGGLALDWGFEAKAHWRDSEASRNPSPFQFPPEFLPPGASLPAFQETVDPGEHFEVSTLTLLLGARWGESIAARAKIDFIDLHDRNPTSSDREIDVDELWLRLGRDPDLPADGFGAYAKVGKFPHFERQNDRHLESYGLISTAFNRFEDAGMEVGFDFGRHFYLRGSLTQGNPLFFRDPNALAGDNGTPAGDPFLHPNPVPELASGFPILYDAEVEDLDVDGDLETGAGLGIRFGEPGVGAHFDLLAWGYRRELADTVSLEGTSYGGDLDLLNGPFDSFSLPISGRDKEEVGANLRFAAGGLALFAQFVDQEVAGMDRAGWEAEAAYTFELPLVWATGGRQLFPTLQPAIRYSFLEPDFAGGSRFYPAPSVRWEWAKLDYGIRLGIVDGIDLTVEYADNVMTLANGRELSADELLATLRWRP